MRNLRVIKNLTKPMAHPDFEFVKAGEENLLIVKMGGKSGRVFTDKKDYEHYIVANHHCIYASEEVIKNFINLESELTRIASEEYSKTRNMVTGKLIRAYISAYGTSEDLLHCETS